MENDDDEEDDDVAKEGKEARYLEASGYLHCQSYCHRSLQLKIWKWCGFRLARVNHMIFCLNLHTELLTKQLLSPLKGKFAFVNLLYSNNEKEL